MKAGNAAILAILVLGSTVPAPAAASFEGRWAADVASCGGDSGGGSLLVVTPGRLRWRDTACVVRTSYLVGKAWHIGARCWAEGVTADVPIKLQLRDDRLVLHWARAPAKELPRCP
jgi:hypothetical protein